jgi:ubiquinone biosynthesis protein
VLEELPEMPELIYEVLERAKEDRLSLELRSAELQALRTEVRRNHRRTLLAVIGAGLLLSGFASAPLDLGPSLGPLTAVSWVLILGGLGAFARAWFDGSQGR